MLAELKTPAAICSAGSVVALVGTTRAAFSSSDFLPLGSKSPIPGGGAKILALDWFLRGLRAQSAIIAKR